AEYLGGRRLLLQRLGKAPPHLGELTGARFELLLSDARRVGHVANARFRLRSGRTKLAAARWTICTFARQSVRMGDGLRSRSVWTEPHALRRRGSARHHR